MAKPEDYFPIRVRLPKHYGFKEVNVFTPEFFRNCPPGTLLLERNVEHKIFFISVGDYIPTLKSKYDVLDPNSFKYGYKINEYSVKNAFTIFQKAIQLSEKTIEDLSKELLKRQELIDQLKRELKELKSK